MKRSVPLRHLVVAATLIPLSDDPNTQRLVATILLVWLYHRISSK